MLNVALIIRIVTFIITLFFIILLLLGATTSFSTEWYESDLYPMKFKVLYGNIKFKKGMYFVVI